MVILQNLTTADLLIIGILVAALVIGWSRGLVQILTGFVVFILSALIAGRYTGAAIQWLNQSWGVQERLSDLLERRILLPSEAYQVPANAVPWDKALGWLKDVPIPPSYKRSMARSVAQWSVDAGGRSAADFFLDQLTTGILTTIVFLVLVSLIGWVMTLLVKALSKRIHKVPVIGTADRFLGSAATLFETVIILALLGGLVLPTLSLWGFGQLEDLLAGAVLTPYFLALYESMQPILFGLAGGSLFTG